jgi:hypothetical protein
MELAPRLYPVCTATSFPYCSLVGKLLISSIQVFMGQQDLCSNCPVHIPSDKRQNARFCTSGTQSTTLGHLQGSQLCTCSTRLDRTICTLVRAQCTLRRVEWRGSRELILPINYASSRHGPEMTHPAEKAMNRATRRPRPPRNPVSSLFRMPEIPRLKHSVGRDCNNATWLQGRHQAHLVVVKDSIKNNIPRRARTSRCSVGAQR